MLHKSVLWAALLEYTKINGNIELQTKRQTKER